MEKMEYDKERGLRKKGRWQEGFVKAEREKETGMKKKGEVAGVERESGKLERNRA